LGPRQAGKSTLALALQGEGIVPNYYNLDEEAIRKVARLDPDGFVADIEKPAVIDEVQRAPDLLLAIKRAIDASDARGQFLLTGSANVLTARAVADALPGRVEYVNLWPLSQGEIEGHEEHFIDQILAGRPPRLSGEPSGRSANADRIVRGGFPDARLRTDRQRGRYFESCVQAAIGRDLAAVGRVRVSPETLAQLLRLLAARSGSLASSNRLASELELDGKTVKAHTAMLEQLFLVHRLRPWSRNIGSRHVKTPKLFVSDTGLLAALIGVDAQRYSAVDQGELAGTLLETFVTMEFVKQRTWASSRTELFFYRDAQQREVDIVVESVAGDVAGVEVKTSASVGRSDSAGLRFLRDKLGTRFRAGVILYSGANTLELDDRIWAVPLAGLWTATTSVVA
jgi:predicted AAA+ superfamily ATPase